MNQQQRSKDTIEKEINSLRLQYKNFMKTRSEFTPNARKTYIAGVKARLSELRTELQKLDNGIHTRMEKLRDAYQGRSTETTKRR